MSITERLTINTYILYYLLATAVLASLTACEKEEKEHLEPIAYQVLDSIVSTSSINFDQALVSLYDNELGADEALISKYNSLIKLGKLRSRAYKAYVINYHTTDPNGKPIVASGVVYYPNSGKPLGVLESVPFNKNRDRCPSQQIANLQALLGMKGYIILVPDQIGCGATADIPISYLYSDNAAKVCADFRLAATELVRNIYGYSMPSWTMVYGISLSASAAWALARYYHQHPEVGVRVNQIWMCSGIYKPKEALIHYLKQESTFYACLPNILYSTNYYDQLGINLQNVFRGELSLHYEEWCSGEIGIFELTNRLGEEISQYLNMDFFVDSNPDYQKILQAADRQVIPNDWKPGCPVHIFHSDDDTLAPFASAEELANHLRSLGVEVEFEVTHNGHVDNCAVMTAELAKYLY